MFEFLIDNIFVMFEGRVFQQTVGILMGTNCGPRLADLFLCSHEADFIQGLLKKNEKKLAQSFNFLYG
jgi:lysyl-tRNA synthetase class I